MNRILAMLLALALALAFSGFAAFAEETDAEETEVQEMEGEGMVEEFSDWDSDFSVDVEEGWPSTLTGVPVFEADSYESWVATDHVIVYLPKGADAGFPDYVKALTDAGAALYVQNELLTVLSLGEMEIQLMPDPEEPSITFFAEPAYDYKEDIEMYPELEEYPMPDTGRLVSLEGIFNYGEEDEDVPETMEMAILTVRNASISDALDYCEKLTMAGWVQQGDAVPEGNALYAEFVKASRTIVVDYFMNGSDYMIVFTTVED
ncbi:MAG: hypothetical protein ACOYI8_08970 [Christensenellales bacterium]|jgi:hypothetical protein